MPQDQSASRMMNTLQTSLSQGSQQFIDPTQQSFQQPQPTALQDDSLATTEFNSVTVEPQGTTSGTSQDQSFSLEPIAISDQQKLAMFENVIQEVQASAPQVPNQAVSGSSAKESLLGASIVAPQELPGGMQYVETEPRPEISPEVESFLQHAQEQPEKLPEEIVRAAADFHQQSVSTTATQEVKVLPITKVQADEGKKKNTSFAVRWLVEFSNKISRLFAGKSIYRAD